MSWFLDEVTELSGVSGFSTIGWSQVWIGGVLMFLKEVVRAGVVFVRMLVQLGNNKLIMRQQARRIGVY